MKGQTKIENSLNSTTREDVDNKLAELVYGENLPFAIVESPRLKALLNAARRAPADYKPPQALSLADKMQTASYKRDVEKWDDDCSDSDSNASDDEADLAV